MKTLLLCFLLMFNAIVNLFFNFYQISKSFCRITKEIHSSPPRKSFNCPAKHLDRPNEFSLFVINFKFYKNEPLYEVF